MLPEGCAQSNVAHEDDVQEDEGRGEEPVHIASIVDAAQVAIRVGYVGTAAQRALRECQWQSAIDSQQREIQPSNRRTCQWFPGPPSHGMCGQSLRLCSTL